MASAQHLPGYRRRFEIVPLPGQVSCALEDDYHCMQVSIRHDNRTALAVRAEMIRAPWSTCPGAIKTCESTFTGIALEAFPGLGDKTSSCTHLYDLALLAAAHALGSDPVSYDIVVSDPVDGVRQAGIWRNGDRVLAWSDRDFRLVEPAELAGTHLMDMRSWIGTLDQAQQEAARLLRWGSVVAHGRTIPLESQSDARRMPPNCYTFQPERAALARRIGAVRDFSDGTIRPLDNLRTS